jgi:hypothetical protein
MFKGKYKVLYKKSGVLLCRKLGASEDLFCLITSKHPVKIGQVLSCKKGFSKVTSNLKKISSLAEKMQILIGNEIRIPFYLTRTRVKKTVGH